MRIALLAPLVTRLQDRQLGGSQTAVCELARGLVAAGETVDLMASAGSRVAGVPVRRLREGPFPDALFELGGEPLTEPPARPDAAWPAAVAAPYARIASDLRHRPPDVVHNHGSDWPAFYALAATGLPTVHTLHLPPLDAAATAAARAAASCRPRPLFVAPSRACAALWRRLLPVDAVVSNGLDAHAVQFSATPQAGLAIIAGRIAPEKGVHLCIDAVRHCGMQALVVGPVYDAAYFETAVAPRLDEEIRWLGPLSRRRLLRLYGRAAVAVLAPMWEEPFGLVALEANLAGTPVAGFRRGGLAEVVGRAGGALSENAAVEGLCQAIGEAVTLDRAAVRRSAARRHSLARMVERYRVLYRAAQRGGVRGATPGGVAQGGA